MTQAIHPDIWGAMNIYAEARGQPFYGQVAVGFVVRERMRLRYFSDGTVVGTIWRPYQFSWTLSSDPQRMRVLGATNDSIEWRDAAAAWAQSEGSDILPLGTVSYHNDKIARPNWAKSEEFVFVRPIGAHLFYRLRNLPPGVASTGGGS